MRLFDNDATASLTDRERRLLEMLARCRHYLADLTRSAWIDGDDAGSVDMRQRASGLARAIGKVIDGDGDLYRSLYGE